MALVSVMTPLLGLPVPGVSATNAPSAIPRPLPGLLTFPVIIASKMNWIAMPSPVQIAEQYRIALLNHAKTAGQPLGPISPARVEGALNAYQLLSNPRLVGKVSDDVLVKRAVGLLRCLA